MTLDPKPVLKSIMLIMVIKTEKNMEHEMETIRVHVGFTWGLGCKGLLGKVCWGRSIGISCLWAY